MEVETEQSEGYQGEENEGDLQVRVHHQRRAVQLHELALRAFHRLRVDIADHTRHGLPSSVQNVSLSELGTLPFKAAVTFQKVYYTPGTRSERNRETYVAQVDFVLREHVPNEFVRVNPLGLQIAYFRVDQAFEDGRR